MTKRIGAIAIAAFVSTAVPAAAETYRHYDCEGGAQFELVLFADRSTAFLQLDGKSLRLPKSLSVTGERYRKNGVTIWIKDSRATLRRAGKRIECTAN
jgi:membrane-bound inhibitor of C-type lysozyme